MADAVGVDDGRLLVLLPGAVSADNGGAAVVPWSVGVDGVRLGLVLIAEWK
jgi:hypothetical protein